MIGIAVIVRFCNKQGIVVGMEYPYGDGSPLYEVKLENGKVCFCTPKQIWCD